MRAGRLLNLLLLLRNGRRWTAAELADRLQVSERTILRDIDALSLAGVPVFGVRGPGGGFELLDTFRLEVPPVPPGLAPTAGQLRRVRVRISPGALQMALLTGTPEGWRPRPTAAPAPDRPDWVEGSFRFDSDESAVRALMALGPDVEVLLPTALRRRIGELAARIASLHHDEQAPDDAARQ